MAATSSRIHKCSGVFLMILFLVFSWRAAEAQEHPNILIAVADDVVYNYFGAYGYHVGKGWGPLGDPGTINGEPRQLLGPAYQEARMDPPTESMAPLDYASNFEQFLEERAAGQPFHFYYGGS